MYFSQFWKAAVALLSIGMVVTVESSSLAEAPGTPTPSTSFLSASTPGPYPINLKVWTNKESDHRYRRGDRVIINLHVDRDCYMAMFAASSDGDVKVLFPNRIERDHKIRKGEIYTFFGDESGMRLILGKRIGKSELAVFVSSVPFRLYRPPTSTKQENVAISVRSARDMKLLREEIAPMAETEDFNRVVLTLAGAEGENFEINLIRSSKAKGHSGRRGLPSSVESKPPASGTGTQGVKTKLPK